MKFMMAVKFELINMASHFVNDFLRIECIMYNEEEPITKIIYDNINIHKCILNILCRCRNYFVKVNMRYSRNKSI